MPNVSSNDSSTYSYYTDPAYNDLRYTVVSQVYFIGCGTACIWLNVFLILLFFRAPWLRSNACNWVIMLQCLSEVMIGVGIFLRGVTFLYAANNTIMDFNIAFCVVVGGFCALGYRIGQTIALLMSFDRFSAVWKPVLYAKRQGNV